MSSGALYRSPALDRSASSFSLNVCASYLRMSSKVFLYSSRPFSSAIKSSIFFLPSFNISGDSKAKLVENLISAVCALSISS